MKIQSLFTLLFFLSTFCFAEDNSKEVASSSESSTEVNTEATTTRDAGTATTEVVRKKKRNFRIQGNFKGKDPMIPPEGNLQPTDGSRPKSR